MPPVSVKINPGTLPPAFPHSTIFFANLASLFFGNTGATLALRKLVGGTLDSYGGRLASVLDLLFHSQHYYPNLLVTTLPPDPELTRYHGDVLGLNLPEIVLADPAHYDSSEIVERLGATAATHLDGFVTDEQLKSIAERTHKKTLSPPEGSHLANNKLAFHNEIVRLGLPTFATEVAENQNDLARCYRELNRQGYRFAAVKSQIGASGIGLLKMDTRRPVEVPDLIFHEGPCLVQGWIEPGIKAVRHVHSPSVQILVSDDEVFLFDTTDQILDHQSIHEGNLSPPHNPAALTDEKIQILDQSKMIVPWLHRTGYRGPASIDFHVARRGEETDIRACEINARVTGATYPSMLARRFQKNGAWLMRNLALPEPLSASAILDMLDSSKVLFKPGASHGCLPINFNTNGRGEITKGQFLFIAPGVDDVCDQMADLVALPQIELQYDRD